jgi:hypothetical protein
MEQYQKLIETISIYEAFRNANNAQCDEAKEALANIRKLMSIDNIEFCSHNASLLGFKWYDKYREKAISRLITCSEVRTAKDKIYSEKLGDPDDFQLILKIIKSEI